jgi:hypothetical protein
VIGSIRPSSEAVPVPGTTNTPLNIDDEEGNEEYSDCDSGEGKLRTPVRRSNSSPEMSSRLKSPLLPPALHANTLSLINNLSEKDNVPPPSPVDDKRTGNKPQPIK